MKKKVDSALFASIKQLISVARNSVLHTINVKMVETYFYIGQTIVEHEQKGKLRAEYAATTLKTLSQQLTKEFGKGFSVDNLENMRKFYFTYSSSNKDKQSDLLISQNSETPSRNFSEFDLSWSHYLLLIRIEDADERQFYELEASNQNWSVRELKRQYNSALYQRLSASRNKKKVKELSKKGHVIETASDIIKDPYILEFLSLEEKESYSEQQLESAIISKLEDFLKELGKGFLFVGRQYRITLDEDHYHIDLVFYHRILRCFVLLDLKIGELKHQDLGQMQMYVNYFDNKIKTSDENKTIGIILCRNKKESVIKYTLPKDNNQIFASKYKIYLPKKDELLLLVESLPDYGTEKQ